MSTTAEMLVDAGLLPNRHLAPHIAAHLGQHPAALVVLRAADGAVGMGVEVLRPQAVASAQRHDAHTVGGHPHGARDRGRRGALDRGVPQHLLVSDRQPLEGRTHQVVVDGRRRVVCRCGRCGGVEDRVLGRHGAQLSARRIDRRRLDGRQEVGPEVGRRSLARPDQVVDADTRLTHDVLSGRATAVAMRHGIRRRQVPSPQFCIRVRIPVAHQAQQHGIIRVCPGLPPDPGSCRHNLFPQRVVARVVPPVGRRQTRRTGAHKNLLP